MAKNDITISVEEYKAFITKELDNVFEAIENAPIVEDRPMSKKEILIKELEEWINRNSLDAMTNTPDYILAEMIMDILVAYNNARYKEQEHMRGEETWHTSKGDVEMPKGMFDEIYNDYER